MWGEYAVTVSSPRANLSLWSGHKLWVNYGVYL